MSKQSNSHASPLPAAILYRDLAFRAACESYEDFEYAHLDFFEYTELVHEALINALSEGPSVILVTFDTDRYQSWARENPTAGRFGSSDSRYAYVDTLLTISLNAHDPDVIVVDSCQELHTVLASDSLMTMAMHLIDQQSSTDEEVMTRISEARAHTLEAYDGLRDVFKTLRASRATFNIAPVVLFGTDPHDCGPYTITLDLTRGNHTDEVFVTPSHEHLLLSAIFTGAVHRASATIAVEMGHYVTEMSWEISSDRPASITATRVKELVG